MSTAIDTIKQHLQEEILDVYSISSTYDELYDDAFFSDRDRDDIIAQIETQIKVVLNGMDSNSLKEVFFTVMTSDSLWDFFLSSSTFHENESFHKWVSRDFPLYIFDYLAN